MSDVKLWHRLQAILQARVDGFDGVAGLCLLDVKTGHQLAINGDESFPTASTIKIHLLAALNQLDHQKVLSMDQRVAIDRKVPGSGVLTYLDDAVDLSWRDVANLMIIVSDNTATNMVIDRLGYERMAAFFKAWGLNKTVLVRKMQEHDAVARNEENLSTPIDEVKMLKLLLDGSALGPGVAQECIRVLKKPKRGFFAPGLPPDMLFANKPGAMDRVRNDAGIIFLPRRPYALTIMTKFGTMEAPVQERWIADTTREIHRFMTILDTTSGQGQGIPVAYLPKGDV
jgi:beta-lactamase class A